MKIDLLYTPTADPSCPWGSLYMLKGFLDEHSAHRSRVRDLNIEWLHYLSQPEQLDRLAREIAGRRSELEAKPHLSAREQFAYYRLLHPVDAPDAAALKEAFDVFRCRERFYDIARYSDALLTLKRWERAMSRITWPGVLDKFTRFGFGPFLNPTSAQDTVADVSDRELGFFPSFLKDCYLPDLDRDPPGAIGISVPFRFQLWHTVALARAVREHAPSIKLVAGGTALQMFKYANLHGRPDGLQPLFSLFDAVVVGEGEEALVRILDAWEAGEALVDDGAAIARTRFPNVVVAGASKVMAPPRVQYLDLNKLSCPNYDDARWDLYLSPEPFLTYSPTRGCYWDRCVFCEIGLSSDRPTSPSRERSYDLVVKDLHRLRLSGRHIYWSVDAIRPAWMVEVSRRIAAEGLDLKWGAEVRLDRKYTAEEAHILKEGGCLAISVGMESGSNRLLALMDKGTTVERYSIILGRLRDAGIAVYPMTFIGFPTETLEEAHSTVDYLLAHQDRLSILAMPATFYLEGNAIITKRPDDFGLVRLDRFRNLDAPNGWYWKSSVSWPREEQAQLLARLNDASTQVMGLLDRPFLGGVDTPHSAFYIEAFGPDGIKQASDRFKEIAAASSPEAPLVSAAFDLQKIIANIWALIDRLDEEYTNLLCPCGEVTERLLGELPSLERDTVRLQVYDPDALAPLDQWLDINFSRDQAREEPMYTQFRPGSVEMREVMA